VGAQLLVTKKNEGRKGGDVINFVALMENCRGGTRRKSWLSVTG
jgi:hypothetical protein